MGTRVNYILRDYEGAACTVLYSNNADDQIDPAGIFVDILRASKSFREAVQALLQAVYPTSEGGHQAQDPIFHLDSFAGDQDFWMVATHDVREGRIHITRWPGGIEPDLDTVDATQGVPGHPFHPLTITWSQA